DRGAAAPRGERAQRSIGEHDETHLVVACGAVFGEARGEVGVMPELAEPVQLGAAGAPGVDGNDDFEVLVLAENARDQARGARRRLPVDRVARIACAILAQMVQLTSASQRWVRRR